TLGRGVIPGSDTAHLALFGYDPAVYYKGRGPFEALGVGFELKQGDVAFRCNFATVDKDLRVIDRRAGRLKDEGPQLAKFLQGIKIEGVRAIFLPSTEHRGTLILRGAGLSPAVSDTDPHSSEPLPLLESTPQNNTQDRYNSIKRALEGGVILPPVELYKIKDQYYVVDGHHRISAGKEMGQEYVDAQIIEYLPAKDSPENALYLRRFDFEQKTGMREVFLSRPSGYDRLIWQIDLHQQYLANKMKREVSIKDAAHDWFYSIYQPVVQKIEKEKLTPREYYGHVQCRKEPRRILNLGIVII
ncbi:unnamed protein product, partial [marine sediment metagenome]